MDPVIRRRGKLADACSMVPGVLSAASGTLPRSVQGSTIAGARVTSTDMAVIFLAGPPAVVKLPLTAAAARGLSRESAALAALHAERRLGEWRGRVPRVLARGTALGRPYRIDTVLPGRVPSVATPALQQGAVEIIHELHRATATEVSGGALADQWVDAPLRELARHGAPRRPWATRILRLREELYGALDGHRVAAGWIHGDYWLGNVLCAGAGERPDGIADWEAAGAPELALHDVLHMLLSGRRLATGEQLGALVRRHLDGTGWSPSERRLLDRYATWCHDGALSDRHALVLYWLRQVAVHARQRSRIGGSRYRWWELRNVQAVLAAL